jgi:hypothetical protein
MIDNSDIKESTIIVNEPYYKGQRILYKGEQAQVIELKPFFTIRVDGKSHLICGDIFDDARTLSKGKEF